MRFATMRRPDGTSCAARVGDDICTELPWETVGHMLQAPGWAQEAQTHSGPSAHVDQVDLAPVVSSGEKIICLGLNYVNHIREAGREAPAYPNLFAKFPESLIGARDPIVLPRVSSMVDWEAELVIVVGRAGRHIARRDALSYIAGYTIMNDISVRDWQRRVPEVLSGKTFESTTPLGPYLVTSDELPPEGTGLAVRCEVDEQLMQDGSTSDMLFKPSDIVSYISTILTLRPGDVIATGTPAGIGIAREPAVFLRPGQVVKTSIEGLGHLENTCVAEGS
jgi:acylpyruvate hydrolase